MGTGRSAVLLVCVGAILETRCGPAVDGGETAVSHAGALPTGGLEVAPVSSGPVPDAPRPRAPLFQPGFHLALRWSQDVGRLTTFRLRVPVNRAGQRIRLAFRSGDGSMVLRRVTVARAGPEGSLASAPVPVTFSGASGFSVEGRTRVVSDPVSFPIVDAGVSGQGFYDALRLLDGEALVLSGITDCIVLLGTNDLSGVPDSKLQADMLQLTERLKPFCRTWVGTLLPKEYAHNGRYEEVKASRLAMNAWVRANRRPDIIDFEAVMHAPDDVHHFIEGLDEDGIHPNAAGHRVMADEVVRVLHMNGVTPRETP